MSWESLVEGMLADENPDLYDELLQEDEYEYEDYVADVAKRMRESYEVATANETDPTRRASAKEVAIAQAREEIAPQELLEFGADLETDEEAAREYLQNFYGTSGI